MKVAITVSFPFKVTEHGFAVSGVQFVQLLNVDEPVGMAVSITVLPTANCPTHDTGATHEVAKPDGELVTVPNPAPAKVTVRVADPLPEKQITFPVIDPVTTAPEDESPPALVFVCRVADTSVVPHVNPVAVSRPVEFTVIIWVVLEAHATWFVMSLVTGG